MKTFFIALCMYLVCPFFYAQTYISFPAEYNLKPYPVISDNNFVYCVAGKRPSGSQPIYNVFRVDKNNNSISQISDFNSLHSQSQNQFTKCNNGILFVSNSNIYKIDSATGTLTMLVSSTDYSASKPFVYFNNSLYFNKGGGYLKSYNLDTSTLNDLQTSNSEPLFYMNQPVIYNNKLYFVAQVNSETAIWESDGTSAGTVKKYTLGNNFSTNYPQNRFKSFVINNQLIFYTHDGFQFQYVSIDPSKSGDAAKNFIFGAANYIRFPFVLNSIAYLYDSNSAKYYKTNGIDLPIDNAFSVDIIGISDYSNDLQNTNDQQFINYNSKVYGKSNETLPSLYSIDGSATPTFVKNISPTGAVVHNNKMYFGANDYVGNPSKLYQSDGTESQTKPLTSLYNVNFILGIDYYLFLFGNQNGVEGLYKIDLNDASLATTDKNLDLFKISPNPTKSYLNFSNLISNISIYDLSGKQVKIFSAKTQKLDVSSLPKGNYILKANNEKNQIISQKFIKE